MNGRARAAAVFVLACFAPILSFAQVTYQPAPPPTVTAENEAWYLAGEPVMYAGQIYYPAGAQVHFRPYEMVASGFYRGIPLYTRTTIESFSIVYVPVGGGLLQPYERRRAGEIAGTTGSTAPSLPTMRSFETPAGGIIQAPAPPTQVGSVVPPAPVVETAPLPPAAPAEGVVGTTGRIPAPPPFRRRPSALNALFVEYGNRRWFSGGPAVPLDRSTMTRIGEYHGFPVYARAGDRDTIYMPVTAGAGELVAPYSTRRR
jgi:hypothetical protein